MKICLQQSKSPLNCLSPVSLPMSAPSLVLAKSKGYTKIKLKLPAKPPDNNGRRKKDPFWVLGSMPASSFRFRASLTLKLMAWVGKYLNMLAQLPLHRDRTPSSYTHLLKQSIMPV